MAVTILNTSTGSSPNIGWKVVASVGTRTPTSVSITYTVTCWMISSAGSLRTGHTLVGYIGGNALTFKTSSQSIGAGWSKSLSKSISHSVSAGTTSVTTTFQGVNSYGNAGDLSKRNCSAVSISSASASFSKVTLSAVADNQTKATATVSGMPNVPYATSIKWYLGDSLVNTTSRSASTSTGSYKQLFTGLLPNTSYTLKIIAYGASTSMSTKSATVTTPQETGKLTLSAKSTYIVASLSDMFNEPNYKRTIDFYYKKSTEGAFMLFGSINSQQETASLNITGLVSNMQYDVKAIIKNGTTALKTLEEKIMTTKDISLIPHAEISNISQQLGTRLCTINWLTNKDLAGTVYKIQAKGSTESLWTDIMTLNSIVSPVIITSHIGDDNVSFRITASNEIVVSGGINISDEYMFYVRDDFVWDTEKIKGKTFKLSANEWNRLADYTVSRNRDIGKDVIIPVVRKGDVITAETYNTMKNAISNIFDVDIKDKKRGDVITASDIDALRIAVNKTS